MVLELWKHLLLPARPGVVVVMSNVDHVVRVDGAEGSQTVAYDSKEGNQNIIDDVDGWFLVPLVDGCGEVSVGTWGVYTPRASTSAFAALMMSAAWARFSFLFLSKNSHKNVQTFSAMP